MSLFLFCLTTVISKAFQVSISKSQWYTMGEVTNAIQSLSSSMCIDQEVMSKSPPSEPNMQITSVFTEGVVAI